MSYAGNQPFKAPLATDQFALGDYRFGRLDGTNLPAGLFKNGFINGSFDHWQRGTGFNLSGSTPQYSADRWSHLASIAGSNVNINRQPFITPGIENGQSEARYYMDITYTGGANAGTASDVCQFRQHIEGVHRYSGRRVVIKGFARQAGGSGKSIAIGIGQNFGSGGSASVVSPGKKIVLQSYFTPFAVVFDVPSIAGKIIGTGDYLVPTFWLSAGSQYNANTDSLGVQDIRVQFSDLEIREVIPGFADQIGAYERVPVDIELLRCQRYYQLMECTFYRGSTSANYQGGIQTFRHPVEMRAAPTGSILTISGGITPTGNPTRAPTAADMSIANISNRTGALWFATTGAVGDYAITTMAFNAEL